MTRLLARRWHCWGFAGTLVFGAGSQACDERFQFDVPNGGGGVSSSAGTAAGASIAGSSLGAATMSGTSSHAGTSGGGASGGSDVGGGVAGDTGLPEPARCGDLTSCPADLHCANNLCSECASDVDCRSATLPRCDTTRYRCVACVTTTDCEEGFACDALANRCLKKCREDGDCKGQHGCDERRLVCYECDEDEECTGSALGPLCASDRSGCVQCRKEADCPGAHCDQLAGRCVECRDGLDCPSRLCSAATFTCQPE